MTEKREFKVGEEVYVVLKRSDRVFKVCDKCYGKPLPIGKRCDRCHGYGDIDDGSELVHWWIGPEKISAVHTVTTTAGTSISYCVDRTFKDQHDPEVVFATQQESEAFIESRRVHLQ